MTALPIENIASTEITQRILVAGTNAGGEPDFFACVVTAAQSDFDDGTHYEMAKELAEDEGYEGPFVCFDENNQRGMSLPFSEMTEAAPLETGNDVINEQCIDLDAFAITVDDKETRINIEIKGLGYLTVNRTYEGLIVDVCNLTDPDAIASLALENEDFIDDYASDVREFIDSFDGAVRIPADFIAKSKHAGLSVNQCIENYFQGFEYDVCGLSSLNGSQSDHDIEATKITRPYLQITPDNYRSLVDQDAVYFMTPAGMVVTLGSTDDSMVLMPLKAGAASVLLEQ